MPSPGRRVERGGRQKGEEGGRWEMGDGRWREEGDESGGRREMEVEEGER